MTEKRKLLERVKVFGEGKKLLYILQTPAIVYLDEEERAEIINKFLDKLSSISDPS